MVVDGGCDGTEIFEDLGNAIRKIRVDLGIDIEWREAITPEHARATAAIRRRSSTRAVTGRKRNGRLVVQQARGRDRRSRRRRYVQAPARRLPHESTGDQWFDEEQFESYRQLGLVTCDLFRREIAAAFRPY